MHVWRGALWGGRMLWHFSGGGNRAKSSAIVYRGCLPLSCLTKLWFTPMSMKVPMQTQTQMHGNDRTRCGHLQHDAGQAQCPCCTSYIYMFRYGCTKRERRDEESLCSRREFLGHWLSLGSPLGSDSWQLGGSFAPWWTPGWNPPRPIIESQKLLLTSWGRTIFSPLLLPVGFYLMWRFQLARILKQNDSQHEDLGVEAKLSIIQKVKNKKKSIEMHR